MRFATGVPMAYNADGRLNALHARAFSGDMRGPIRDEGRVPGTLTAAGED